MSDQPPSGPDFTRPPQGWAPPPASGPADPPQQGFAPLGQQGWPPPGQPPPYPAPQQAWAAQPQPNRPRRRRWPLAAAVALLVLVLGGGALFVPSVLDRPAAPTAATPTSTALPLVTVTPTAQPSAQTTLTSGGDLGSAIPFTVTAGTGSLTVTRATWTHAGQMAPPDGDLYLILDVTVACARGKLDVSSLSLRTTADPAAQTGFGAELPDGFPGVRLTAGQQQAGQIGFVLAPGEVTVALVDPATLKPVATRVVPGP